MRDRVFQDAYDRVRGRFTDEAWMALQPSEITRAIYAEMRALDAERSRAPMIRTPGRPRASDRLRNIAS